MPDLFSKKCDENCTQYFGASTPVFINGTRVGVYGAMLDAYAFNQLIKPLTEIDTSWM